MKSKQASAKNAGRRPNAPAGKVGPQPTAKVQRPPDLVNGVPQAIVRWVQALPAGPRGDRYRGRLQRFVEHWRQHARIEKDWLALQSATKSDDDLQALFTTLPDGPSDPENPSDYQPFANVVGRRTALPSEEEERYRTLSAQATALAEFLSPQRREFRHLLSDLSATPAHSKIAKRVRDECGLPLRQALRVLSQALSVADPFGKVPTKQPNAPDRAMTIYTQQVADLARFLVKPKWEALANVANVNCPRGRVTADALRQQAKRKANKTT